MRKFASALTVAMLSGVATPALAQDAPADEGQPAAETEDEVVDDIIVTAQRRDQRLRDVPISIAAVTGDQIAEQRVENLNQLSARVPGVSGQASSPVQPRIVIRGISTGNFGIGGDTSVGVYIDDVYAGRAAGSLSNLFDVQQVEIVKGPQGTLFGRNTTAGAISIRRNLPGRDLEGFARGALGNDDLRELEATVNLPLSDTLSSRFSGYYRDRDGWVTNLNGGRKFGFLETGNVRAAVRFQQGVVDVTAQFDYQKDDGTSAIYRSLIFPPGGGFRTLNSDLLAEDADLKRDIYLGSLRATIDVGDWGDWTTIAAYREYEMEYRDNSDGTTRRQLLLELPEAQQAYSLESRLSFEFGDFEGVIGGNFFREKVRQGVAVTYDEDDICGGLLQGGGGPPDLPCQVVIPIITRGAVPGFAGRDNVTEAGGARGNYRSISAFGDVTWSFASQFDFTAGVRFNRDIKRLVVNNPPVGNPLGNLLGAIRSIPPGVLLLATQGDVRLKDSWNSVQPRFVLSFKPDDDQLLYASASRGFTAGGFNSLLPQFGGYDPESIWSYELGAKGALFDRRLTFELSGFYYKYDDLQVQVTDPVAFVRNAGEASGRGVEFSANATVSSTLSLDLGLAYIDARYDDYRPDATTDLSGNRLPQSPRFTASGGIHFDQTFSDASGIEADINVNYRSPHFFDERNRIRQNRYALLDVRVGYTLPGGNLTISAFGTNLTDADYIIYANDISGIGIRNIAPGPPRYYGVEARVRF